MSGTLVGPPDTTYPNMRNTMAKKKTRPEKSYHVVYLHHDEPQLATMKASEIREKFPDGLCAIFEGTVVKTFDSKCDLTRL